MGSLVLAKPKENLDPLVGGHFPYPLSSSRWFQRRLLLEKGKVGRTAIEFTKRGIVPIERISVTEVFFSRDGFDVVGHKKLEVKGDRAEIPLPLGFETI